MAHFTQGATPHETATLQARAAAFNQGVPGKFTPNGLNQPIMLSPSNGNSAADASRQTPSGELPSMNGMSRSTYDKLNPTSYGLSLNI
jgi:hypothetical protein